MSRLCKDALKKIDASNVLKPAYDRSAVSVGILHYGVGNFHRSHQAMYVDKILGTNPDWGICGVNILDRGMAENMRSQDCLFGLWERPGTPLDQSSLKVIGSHVDSLYTPNDSAALMKYFSDPNVKLITLTVTEKGYGMDLSSGVLQQSFYQNDFENFSDLAKLNTAVGQIVYGLKVRKELGLTPFTILSCDNIQENGCKAKSVLLQFAEGVDPTLRSWIEKSVPFPNSMVDRITPRATPEDQKEIERRFGVIDSVPVVSEDFTQWVIEDEFVNGRLPVENEENITFTSDVLPFELMKLRLLNSSHQVLAYPAILVGHRFVHSSLLECDNMRGFLDLYMRLIASTLPPIPGVSFDEYVDTLLRRYSNANCADTLLRLSEDSVNRLETAFLPSLPNTTHALDIMALPMACWVHYWAKSVDDAGAEFVKTPDEKSEPLISAFKDVVANPTQANLSDLLARTFTNTQFDPAFVSVILDFVAKISQNGTEKTMGMVNEKYARHNF